MLKLYVLISVLLVSGCARLPTVITGGDRINSEGSELGGESTLYVFRSENTLAPGFAYNVNLDGTDEFSLRRQQYSATPVASGSHIIFFDCSWPCEAGAKFQIDIGKGKTYYLMYQQGLTLKTLTTIGVNDSLKFIPKDEAESYMKQYRKVVTTSSGSE